MPNRLRTFPGELATALAVVAMYVLTLLLPLHSAAATQRDMAQLGFETIGGWSICGQSTPDDGVPAALKCPATGVGKQDYSGPLPVAPVFAAPDVAIAANTAGLPANPAGLVRTHSWQSRAPPALA